MSMLDDNTKLQFVVSQFNELELLLSDCLGFIPFIEGNKEVISPKFTLIIVECCGLIESIFKEYAGKKNKRQDMREYSKLVDPHLDLEEAITIFLYPPILFLNPFNDWTKKPPTWWQAYNKLKHDRLNSYDMATYETVIQAMAGLHQVISRNTEFLPLLLSAGWFNSNSTDVGELVAARILSSGVPIQTIPVESRFFVSPLHSNFATYEQGQLIVKDCDFTNRVKEVLTVYEWF